jgi:hypothetical protein
MALIGSLATNLIAYAFLQASLNRLLLRNDEMWGTGKPATPNPFRSKIPKLNFASLVLFLFGVGAVVAFAAKNVTPKMVEEKPKLEVLIMSDSDKESPKANVVIAPKEGAFGDYMTKVSVGPDTVLGPAPATPENTPTVPAPSQPDAGSSPSNASDQTTNPTPEE